MNYFTQFGTEKGPDVGYPSNQTQGNPAPIRWVGEMDPGSQNPLDLNQNLVDMPVSDQTVWGIPTGEYFGNGMI